MKAVLLAVVWAGMCLAQVRTGVVERVSEDSMTLRGNHEFTVDSNTAIYGQPTAGRIVRVHHDGGRATTIAVRTTIKGEVSELQHGRWFVVSGRTAYILRDTRFGTSARQLHSGQTVEVSGWPNAKGDIEAEQVIIYNTDLPVDVPARR